MNLFLTKTDFTTPFWLFLITLTFLFTYHNLCQTYTSLFSKYVLYITLKEFTMLNETYVKISKVSTKKLVPNWTHKTKINWFISKRSRTFTSDYIYNYNDGGQNYVFFTLKSNWKIICVTINEINVDRWCMLQGSNVHFTDFQLIVYFLNIFVDVVNKY